MLGSQCDGDAPGAHHFALSEGGHREVISIQAIHFSLPSNPNRYSKCDTKTSQCCPEGLERQQVEHGTQKNCDKIFQVGRWVYGDFSRELSQKSTTITCAEWADTLVKLLIRNHAAQSPPPQAWSSSAQPTRCEAHQQATSSFTPSSDVQGYSENIPQRPPQRDRIDDSSNAEPLERDDSSAEPSGGNSDGRGSGDIDRFVETFVKKVKKGLEKMQKKTAKSIKPSEGLGTLLFKHRQAAIEHQQEGRSQNTSKLETLLKVEKGKNKNIKWLTDLLYRYTSFRNRRLDPAYSKTGDCDMERSVKNKESLCDVTNRVVNGLAPLWGSWAILVYSAIEETKFKGSALYEKVRKDSFEAVTEQIIQSLSKIEELKLPRQVEVLNPACFISCVEVIPYSQVCKEIGLDNLAIYDLQKEVDHSAANLEQLALDCARIPLSALPSSGGAFLTEDPESNILTIQIRPTQASTSDSPEPSLDTHSTTNYQHQRKRKQNYPQHPTTTGKRAKPMEAAPSLGIGNDRTEFQSRGPTYITSSPSPTEHRITSQEPQIAEATRLPIAPPNNACLPSRPSPEGAGAHGREMHDDPEQYSPDPGSLSAIRPATPVERGACDPGTSGGPSPSSLLSSSETGLPHQPQPSSPSNVMIERVLAASTGIPHAVPVQSSPRTGMGLDGDQHQQPPAYEHTLQVQNQGHAITSSAPEQVGSRAQIPSPCSPQLPWAQPPTADNEVDIRGNNASIRSAPTPAMLQPPRPSVPEIEASTQGPGPLEGTPEPREEAKANDGGLGSARQPSTQDLSPVQPRGLPISGAIETSCYPQHGNPPPHPPQTAPDTVIQRHETGVSSSEPWKKPGWVTSLQGQQASTVGSPPPVHQQPYQPEHPEVTSYLDQLVNPNEPYYVNQEPSQATDVDWDSLRWDADIGRQDVSTDDLLTFLGLDLVS